MASSLIAQLEEIQQEIRQLESKREALQQPDVADGFFAVSFDDGDYEDHIPLDRLRRRTTSVTFIPDVHPPTAASATASASSSAHVVLFRAAQCPRCRDAAKRRLREAAALTCGVLRWQDTPSEEHAERGARRESSTPREQHAACALPQRMDPQSCGGQSCGSGARISCPVGEAHPTHGHHGEAHGTPPLWR